MCSTGPGSGKAAERVVYSRTLVEPRSPRTRIERVFDPEAGRRLKSDVEHDISVDGPELAAQAMSSYRCYRWRVCDR